MNADLLHDEIVVILEDAEFQEIVGQAVTADLPRREILARTLAYLIRRMPQFKAFEANVSQRLASLEAHVRSLERDYGTHCHKHHTGGGPGSVNVYTSGPEACASPADAPSAECPHTTLLACLPPKCATCGKVMWPTFATPCPSCGTITKPHYSDCSLEASTTVREALTKLPAADEKLVREHIAALRAELQGRAACDQVFTEDHRRVMAERDAARARASQLAEVLRECLPLMIGGPGNAYLLNRCAEILAAYDATTPKQGPAT